MKQKGVKVSGGLRTKAESEEGSLNKQCFDKNPSDWEKKMENFPKYVKRQNLTRFLALYEIFRRITDVKGSIIECGVNHGFGLMAWTKLSAILEPVNLTRRIYGFDTFEGFPEPSKQDKSQQSNHIKAGDLSADTYDELLELNTIHDTTEDISVISSLHTLLVIYQKTYLTVILLNHHNVCPHIVR